MFDFIGDIHGHADHLEKLLEKMGYKKEGGVYCHPTRKAFFLGDFIDRGPKILEVLNIVIPMVEVGSAQSIMGNHEFNYLGFHTPTKSGEGFIRARTDKNRHQCQETLSQLSDSENKRLLSWIWHLPLWVESDSFRAVHACWDDTSVEMIKSSALGSKLNLETVYESSIKSTPAYHAIETLLKGKEVSLPPNLHFHDKDGYLRTEARVCWWDPKRKFLLPQKKIDPGFSDVFKNALPFTDEKISKPIFFGHYWESGVPQVVNKKAVCLDYSVAKNGHLCAYRFDGEEKLASSKLIWV